MTTTPERHGSLFTRRRLARTVVVGGGAGVAALVTGTSPADAAPGTTAWALGGNTGVNTDGTNFLGTTNPAALVLKTASVAGNPLERMRITPAGSVTIKRFLTVGANAASDVAVTGTTVSATGIGVKGVAPNSISNALSAMGAQGVGTVGVQGTGEYMGVQGSSLNYGAFGYTTPDTGGIGVYGRGGTGVKGRSYSGIAVYGDTDDGVGVKGESYSDGGAVKAVYGQGLGVNNNGVVGESSNGTQAYGVWGISSTGYAGVFSGNALVTGTLAKGGGSFQIDHPLDPENKYLYHSFVESPDMKNVYDGTVTTDAAGEATITMPDWFERLNRDFRYQLTVHGTEFVQAIVRDEMKGGSFTIATSKPATKVSWQVTGIRQDAFANKHRIPVELAKPAHERGTYLHPDAYGKPASKGFQHARMAAAHPAARAADPKPPH